MKIENIGNVAININRIADSRPAAQMPALSVATRSAAPLQTNNAVQAAIAAPSMDQVKQAVDSINQSMQSLARGLEFTIDDESERVVVKVVDPETSEVIRQIPSDETLAIAKSLDQVIGKLIREKA